MKPVILKGRIHKLFRNCPKPNGWFGCFFHDDDLGDVTVTGITSLKLYEQMCLEIIAHVSNRHGRTEYIVEQMDVQIHCFHDAVLYLSVSANRESSIPHYTVQALYDLYGNEILDKISADINCMTHIGISYDKATLIQRRILNDRVDMKLRSLFPGLSPHTYDMIVRHYPAGNALTSIYEYPYELYFYCHVPFSKVDSFACSIGFESKKERVQGVLVYQFRNLTNNGDVFLNLSDDVMCGKLIRSTIEYLNQPVSVDYVMGCLNTHPYLIVRHICGTYCLYEKEICQQECAVVDNLLEQWFIPSMFDASAMVLYHIDEAISRYEQMYHALDSAQKTAVHNAILNPLSVVTGSPGCGKTTVIGCILFTWGFLFTHHLHLRHPKAYCVAPTGRAVKRMDEILQEHQIKGVYSMTIDSFIMSPDGKAGAHNALFIVDESSMVSLFHLSCLMQSCAHCHFVFVGDENQLGCVGTGRVFSDICRLPDIQKTELSICYRMESRCIMDNARLILSGNDWKSVHCDGTSFMFYPNTKTDFSYLEYIGMVYRGYLQKGVDFNEITVLSPVKNGPVGVKNLNLHLQESMNPKKSVSAPKNVGESTVQRGFEIPDTYYAGYDGVYTRLRIGDKVMQTVNRNAGYHKKNVSGSTFEMGCGISNGDCGLITKYGMASNDDGNPVPYLIFCTDDGREYKIFEKHFGELDLAYATTIHKAQGSELDTVILSMPDTITHYPSDFDFASRNLLFTGLTRAKSSVSVIGSLPAIERCIQTLPHERNSYLSELVSQRIRAKAVIPYDI